MNPPKTIEQVLEYYRENLATQRASAENCAGRWSSFGYMRGGLFLTFLAALLMGFANVSELGTVWWLLSGLLFVGFLVVAYIHEGMQTELRRATILSKMHEESIARCNRKWDAIKVPEVEVPAEFVPISTDLDLLGDSSVYKLLGITRTPLGTETLRQWIIEGALSDEIKRRQAAVAELKPELEWRLKFRLLCEQLSASQSGPSRFVDWCESPNWYVGREWVLLLSRATAVVSLVALILLITGMVSFQVGILTLIVTCVINFGLSIAFAGAMHDVFNLIASRTDQASHYVSLFDMASEYPAKSEKLQSLQTRLKRTGDGAQTNVHRLGWIIGLANLRNGLGFILYIVFEFLFFWDAHVLSLMEKWKQKNGSRARAWFADLGEWEALCSLAKLASDQPDWVFPTVEPTADAEQTIVSGTQVGHPLLDENRVPNDVQIGPPGTVLLVTGSNMSGKSTLLRSVGVNIVLAQMGSVVCAKQLTLPPIHIETSMRIADSLADGVSFFMAELKRLKSIVDTAKDHDGENPKRMMFLLDEILQGTNSRERQIAVSRVVRKLIDENSIGAISTHDLDLATTDELAIACQTVHFAEQFKEIDGKKVMTFDYQMKSGIAETTNALKLLEMVGLGDERD
ncbi:MAG: ABC-type multidrug transport system fused ATPase/permease subunit [Mariniblastus sp.]|jgi:ABC-type multidrug transport system fused ATPase/permease subunit